MSLRKHLTYTAYGLGQMAEGLKNGSFEVYIFFYYTSVLGLSGTLAGLATFLALFVDAVSDPVVGSLSDQTRGRFGRRHPWLYFSPIPLAVLFVLLFRPPAGLGETGLFLWLLGFAVLTRFAITLFHVPHMALGADGRPKPPPPPFDREFLGHFGPLRMQVAAFRKTGPDPDLAEIEVAKVGDVMDGIFIVRQIGLESVMIGFVGYDPSEDARVPLSED